MNKSNLILIILIGFLAIIAKAQDIISDGKIGIQTIPPPSEISIYSGTDKYEIYREPYDTIFDIVQPFTAVASGAVDNTLYLDGGHSKVLLYPIHKYDTLTYYISGLIEIDNHTFLNDTIKNSIKVELSVLGIRIHDSNTEYKSVPCSRINCDILHLRETNNSHFIIFDDTTESPYKMDSSGISIKESQFIKLW